jgi:tripartite ATP-independent transporter DctM subunit
MAAVAACGGFGAVCGSSTATASTMGIVALPELRRYKYAPSLATGTIAAGGTLGILIPPSVMLIVMGPLVGVPISDLFAAAIIPGLMLSATYLIYAIIRCQLDPSLGPILGHESTKHSMGMKARELLLGVIPIATVIMATLGLILAGITTPTDAAATGAFASLLLSLAYRRMGWLQLVNAVYRTMETTAFIMFLIGAANFFGAVFARLGSGRLITDLLTGLAVSPMVMLVLMLLLIFALGGPLEWIPIVLVIVPIFLPVVKHMGIDPLWFSILVAVTLQSSWLTPPMALSSYFLKGVVPQWSMKDIYLGMLQFVFLQALVVALLIKFPIFVTWLPRVTGLQ